MKWWNCYDSADDVSLIMKTQILSLMLVASLLSPCPVLAQSASFGGEKEEAAAARSGVRFVLCSPSGAQLPSPLYYKAGKEYRSVRIGGRTPSQRIRPEAGQIVFYDEDPSAAQEVAKADRGAKPAAMPKPVLTVSVPAGFSSHSVCIVVPSEKSSKAQTFFLNEKDFPSKGTHVINFSSAELQMTTSRTGDLTGPDAKTSKIGPFQREQGISKSNSWSFSGEDGEAVSFILTAKQKDGAPPKRIKAAKFLISSRQSQITIVIKDPACDAFKMLSIQLSDASR